MYPTRFDTFHVIFEKSTTDKVVVEEQLNEAQAT